MAETTKKNAETPESTEKTAQKKKSRKDAEIENLKKELAEKNDLLIRTAAEFDNFESGHCGVRKSGSN